MSNGELITLWDVKKKEDINIKLPTCTTCVNYNPGLAKGFCKDCVGSHIFSNNYYQSRPLTDGEQSEIDCWDKVGKAIFN